MQQGGSFIGDLDYRFRPLMSPFIIGDDHCSKYIIDVIFFFFFNNIEIILYSNLNIYVCEVYFWRLKPWYLPLIPYKYLYL